jgi:predicted CXXCH cytochrome family protein
VIADLLRHGGHLIRVAGLFLAAGLAFMGLRGLLVPQGFGVYGHYRAGAIEENRVRPAAFAGRAACVECHADVPGAMQGGKHLAINCEACHGALGAHATDPGEKKAVKPDAKALCARCHAANVARPKSFPQVDVAEHMGDESCTSCHVAHKPGMQEGGGR